jgi:signal peptidase
MVTGAKPVVVLSGSMRPTFEVGTIIYYKHVPQEQIAPNDIITYQMGKELVTHRVKRIENNEYIMQGDANNTEDGRAVSYDSVQGKVGGLAIPIVGFGVQFINTNMWIFIVMVAILVAEFLLSNIKSDTISTSEKGHGHEKE